MVKSANVLGVKYKIEVHKISEDNSLKNNNWSGYCDEYSKLIVIADMSDEEYYGDWSEEEKEAVFKQIMRHELTHAFLNESGLSYSSMQYSSGWAKNEEMVDWIAIQSPKMFELFKKCGCL